MNTEERHIEAAEAMVQLEQEEAVATIQRSLAAPGREDCADCGGPIGALRRAALPSATRCIPCQHKIEIRGFRGY